MSWWAWLLIGLTIGAALVFAVFAVWLTRSIPKL